MPAEKPPLPPVAPRQLEPPSRLPPLHPPPKRSLSPSAQRAVRSSGIEPDASTPARNETAALFHALCSVFDEMTQAGRLEFIELARYFVELGPEGRRAAMWVIGELRRRHGGR